MSEILDESITRENPGRRAPLVLDAPTFHAVTDRVSNIVERKTPKGWVLLTMATGFLFLVLAGSITKLVGTSAWYAPGASVVEMVETILLDKHKILPCSVFLQGEYGMRDVYLGVPVKLGARGVEQIVEIELTPEEKAALQKSADAVRELFGLEEGQAEAQAPPVGRGPAGEIGDEVAAPCTPETLTDTLIEELGGPQAWADTTGIVPVASFTRPPEAASTCATRP